MSASTLGALPYSRSITRIVLANISHVFSGTLNVTSRIGFFDFLASFGVFIMELYMRGKLKGTAEAAERD